MPQTVQDPLLHVAQLGDQLIVRRRKSPMRTKLLLTVTFITLLSFVLATYLIAARYRSGLWIYVVIVGIVLMALAERAWILRQASKKDELFRFDKCMDRMERNGQVLAPLSDISHILVRHIRPEDDDLTVSDLALVVALEDTRRFTIADSTGLPANKSEIEKAAEELAGYVGVPIKKDSRRVTEWWMDQ